MLDENRGRSQLAQRAGVAVEEVRDLAVWGNHSSTQFPDFYHATISGRPAAEVVDDEAWLQGEFIETVQQQADSARSNKGASGGRAVIAVAQILVIAEEPCGREVDQVLGLRVPPGCSDQDRDRIYRSTLI